MRNSLPYLFILLVLLAMASFAWLTAHPADPVIDRAMHWPGVGAAARWFRATYPISPPRPSAISDSGSAYPEVLGVRPEIWLEPGTVLRERPHELAAKADEIGETTNALLLERRGSWYLVSSARQGGGWAYLPDYREPDSAILGSGLIPPGPLPPRRAEPERIAQARELLGEAGMKRRLGPYVLVTDIDDARLWAGCEELVTRSEKLYANRYGVVPVEEPMESIVAFSKGEDFRKFVASEGVQGSSGHTRGGLIALQVEHRLREEILATLAHEIAHLLNRRALGPALPLWLEEGIAEDFASQLSRPLVMMDEEGWWATGPGAAPLLLREARSKDEAPRLEQLASNQGIARFLDSEDRALYYSSAGLWVRFLVELETGDGFEGYLRGIAAGGPFRLEALEQAMVADSSRLEERFWPWFAELESELQALATPSGSSSRQSEEPSG